MLRLKGGGFYVAENRALRRADELRVLKFLASGQASVQQVGDRIRALGDVRYAWQIIQRELHDAACATRLAVLGRIIHAVDDKGVLRVNGAAPEMKSYRNWADRGGRWNELVALE